jgi:uncharacterized 2Fe-2S/4Fe-4S cluster protein (DUF4445 family)
MPQGERKYLPVAGWFSAHGERYRTMVGDAFANGSGERSIEMTLTMPSWINHQPMVELVPIELPLPSLDDNIGDLDRLLRALRQKGFKPVRFLPSQINHLAHQIRLGQFNVNVALGYHLCHWELIEVYAGLDNHPVLGFAVDLGSSRIGFYLLDLQSSEVLAERSVSNPQIPHGEDILTRILFARKARNLKILQRLLLDTFSKTMQNMLDGVGYSSADVLAVAVAGNTTMSHFFMGIDPANICKEPYIPMVNQFPISHASDFKLAAHPLAPLYLLPNVGSYFGGDLIADILSVGLHRTDELSILVDVGTNAEVVLGNRDWLIACAGAAGPALEGGVVERGMMALPGAIDRVRIDMDTLELSYHVLGEGKAAGICGSGLIDLFAEMFMSGILTIQGKINRKIRSSHVVDTPEGTAYRVATGAETIDGQDLLISEIDIGIFLKSKAAMYTILTVITRKVGLGFDDLKRFYVAGAFGNYIDPSMGVKIGMLPDLPLETYQGLGDTVGCGAAMTLIDRATLHEIERVCRQITYIELNVNVELMNEFRGALFLPHTDPRLFPSVRIPTGALA